MTNATYPEIEDLLVQHEIRDGLFDSALEVLDDNVIDSIMSGIEKKLTLRLKNPLNDLKVDLGVARSFAARMHPVPPLSDLIGKYCGLIDYTKDTLLGNYFPNLLQDVELIFSLYQT
ncbi:hypothetical protein ACFLYT_01585 [Nanoarchaeota archaeon]